MFFYSKVKMYFIIAHLQAHFYVKVDILAHKYPSIGKKIDADNLRIASMDDISAMKVNSVANDGTRVKDFIDLYFLIAEFGYSIEKLLLNYAAKYSRRNTMHALKSLDYFDDADTSEWPVLLRKKDTSWEKVQDTLSDACATYIRKITRKDK